MIFIAEKSGNGHEESGCKRPDYDDTVSGCSVHHPFCFGLFHLNVKNNLSAMFISGEG